MDMTLDSRNEPRSPPSTKEPRMSPKPRPPQPEAPPEPEIQQGEKRGPRKDNDLKRVIKQHERRDEPRVDSVEEDETPPS